MGGKRVNACRGPRGFSARSTNRCSARPEPPFLIPASGTSRNQEIARMQIRKWVGQPIGLVNPCDGLTNPWTQLEKSAYCSPSPFCDALLRAIWPRWPHRRRGRRLRSPVMASASPGSLPRWCRGRVCRRTRDRAQGRRPWSLRLPRSPTRTNSAQIALRATGCIMWL